MRKLLPAIIAIALCLGSCTQEPIISDSRPAAGNGGNNYTNNNSKPDTTPATKDGTIPLLIDASRDGGVWWFPQAGNFSATETHQGQALASYLRSMGYKVVEVPRGQPITWSYLSQFQKVIRFVGCGTYSQEEINAYDSLASHSASILMIQDHLQNFPNDPLSAHWGLDFSGSMTGSVTQFAEHPITIGVTSLYYMAGSVIVNPDPKKITVLGAFPGSEPQQAAIGILHHPTSKIVFMGDGNLIEAVPQPFTDNLVNWLFR